jgi:hypothetical protein
MSPPLGHIILIPSHPAFALSLQCRVLSGEAANENLKVLGVIPRYTTLDLIVGLLNNSWKPITNTAWVRARLCKLQKKMH